jgi:hypothetical protein
MSDESSPSVAPEAPRTAPAPEHTLGATLRTIAIGASFGAAVIHFALAPTHLDERTVDGVFFLVVAWAQVAVAAAVHRWGDRREPWLGALAVHAGVLLVWLGSRTIGFPESHHSSIGFPDTLAAVLEATVVLAAVAHLAGSVARRPAPAVGPVAFGLAGLALAGLVSASVTPRWAGEAAGHGHEAAGGTHAHGEEASGDGHAHGAADAQQVADGDRCDLGFNTEAYNDAAVPGMPHAHDDGTPVDFTLDEWAEVFVNPDNGATPEQVVGYIEDQPTMRDAILTGSLTHSLDPDPWNALTDEEECAQLADELDRAKQVAATYPTVADAEAAGFRMVTTYLPGIAAHYIKPQHFADGFVLEEPEMLLYDGTDPESHVVGLSYYIFQEGDTEPTEGFTGDNDHYHRHTGLCFADGVVVGGTNTTDEQCAALGGSKSDGSAGWMSHVWIVPGCESDWGVFSGANPALEVRTGQEQWESGCGTGRTLDDPLGFEAGGNGPQELAAG